MGMFVSLARNIISCLSVFLVQLLHLLSKDVAKAVKVYIYTYIYVINLFQIGLYCKLQPKSHFSMGAKSQAKKKKYLFLCSLTAVLQ